MYINGKRIIKNPVFVVTNPYSGSQVGEVASAGAGDIEMAMAAAEKGAKIMRGISAGERADILEKTARALLADPHLAGILSSEVGKTIREARMEVARAANTLRLSASAALSYLTGETVRFDLSGPASKTGYYIKVPVGIVLAITPFNFPLNLTCHKIGPAIAAGNAVIHKPSSLTPLVGLRLAELLIESGLPPEALSVVTGPGGVIGDMLLADNRIRKISFTGSMDVGAYITSRAGVKRVTMELGSNSAALVFADAQLDKVAKKIKAAGYACAGQVCISVQRVYVEDKAYDSFLDTLIKEVKTIKTGDPSLEDTDMGPLVEAKEAERVNGWIDEAVRDGGAAVLRGQYKGALMDPVILTNVPETSKAVVNEAFGPYIVVNRFKDFEDGISKVNASRYGLQAGVFTRDFDTAMAAADRIEAGGILVNEVSAYRVDNMPYGGMKMSGIGREGPQFVIDEMTDKKLIIFNSPMT